MDQRAAQKTTSTVTPRWVVKFLEFMLDQTSINAQSVYGLNMGKDPRKTDSYQFTEKLGQGLVLPYMRERYAYSGQWNIHQFWS